GKRVIQAEAFTELREAWDEYPGMLKTLQDRNYTLGINRLVFHVFVHNPWVGRRPGMTLGGVGTYLQRDQTWWPASSGWVAYTQRCQWLLQQGRPVADIAVFTGSEIPRRAVLPERLTGTLPGLMGAATVNREAARLRNAGEPVTKFPNGVSHAANMADPAAWIDPLRGYAYDSYNEDALLRLATVQNGRVAFPGGASYAMLVLPGPYPLSPDPAMISLPAARRLLELVRGGATLLIADTAAAFHVGGLGGEDAAVQAVFHELMTGKVGRGRVICGPWKGATLGAIGLGRDFEATESGAWATGIAYTHRRAPGEDIYFISNQLGRPRRLFLSLRAAGRIPEGWDAVTGQRGAMPGWQTRAGRTTLPLTLAANGSIFIVLREKAEERGQPASEAGTIDRVRLQGP